MKSWSWFRRLWMVADLKIFSNVPIVNSNNFWWTALIYFISQNDYSESCRQILRETCSKLRGKFLSKKSFIGCQPLLREDKVSTGQHCKIIKPNLGLNWISSECHVLDILSGAVDYGHVSCHDMSMSANISIPCFGENFYFIVILFY